MDCMEFQKLTEDYENLSDENKNRMQKHIEACSECAELFDEYKEMCEVLKTMPRLTAPDDFVLNLNKRIDRENNAKSRFLNNIKKYSYRYGAAAACITLITIVGINANDYIEQMNGSDNGIIESIDFADSSSTALPMMSVKPEATKLPATLMPSADSGTEKHTEQPTKATSAPTEKPVKTTSAPRATTKSVSTPHTTAIPKPNRATLSPTVAPRKAYDEDSDYSITISEATTAAPTENASEYKEPVAEEHEKVVKILNPNEYELPNSDETAEHSSDTDMYSKNINSIEVSYAKADMVKEIMNEYALSQNGELYNISTDVFDELQQEMNNIGIEIENSLIDSESNTIMFKIVVS